MSTLLSNMGRSFLRAFVASLIVFLPGLLTAPDLHGAIGLGISALIASISAGLRAIQTYIPKLSIAAYVKAPYGVWADSFGRAFLATLVTSLIGILAMPDLSAWKSLVTSALVGAITAGFRVVQGAGTVGEEPKPGRGLWSGPTPPGEPVAVGPPVAAAEPAPVTPEPVPPQQTNPATKLPHTTSRKRKKR